jgi:hypothetical protein
MQAMSWVGVCGRLLPELQQFGDLRRKKVSARKTEAPGLKPGRYN